MNIYGAGHAVPPAPGGGGGGALPAEIKLPVIGVAQQIRVVGVIGTVAGWPGAPAVTADGFQADPTHQTKIQSWQGISGAVNEQRSMYLVGVFLPAANPTDPAPASGVHTQSEFTTAFQPSLGQVFAIGNGQTFDGVQQVFVVPTGATRLFLGFVDGLKFQGLPGYYHDNAGTLKATVHVDPVCAP